MSGTYRHGRVYCQMADCRNRATRLAKVELPASWSEADEYSVRSVLLGVCGECGRDLEARNRALSAVRDAFERQEQTAAKALQGYRNLSLLLVELLKVIGAPFEPHPGSTYARWLAQLDQPHAQIAWNVLAHVRRHATPSGRRAAVAAVPGDGPWDPAA
jgi:hypothetical protein